MILATPLAGTVGALFRKKRMNANALKGDWKRLRERVHHSWSELTEDDLDQIDGREDILEDKLQERYGLAREEAQQQIREFRQTCGC